jgi:mannitol-1-/sugar-/sorbitol-6-phosphatase
MTKIACGGVLFDLDGVLVDSTPAVARCWTKWSRRHGFDPEEVVRTAHGRPSIATMRELLPGLSQSDHQAANSEMEQWEIEDLDGVVPLSGALELLQALPAKSWVIVTSCTRPLAEVRIRAAGLPMPRHLVTAADVQNGKPDPEPYLKGAERLGLAPRDCVVMEDAPAGIRAGKAAQASVVAVRTTASDAELSAAGADWIVRDLSSVRFDPLASSQHLDLLLEE